MPRSLNATTKEESIPELVDTRKAAKILGRSPNTLKRWRYEGVGPDYVVIRGRVIVASTMVPVVILMPRLSR